MDRKLLLELPVTVTLPVCLEAAAAAPTRSRGFRWPGLRKELIPESVSMVRSTRSCSHRRT